MKRANKTLCIGMLFVGLSFILKHLSVSVPDFIMGLLLGTGVALELIGVYAMKHDLSRFRNYKKKIFNRLIGKGA